MTRIPKIIYVRSKPDKETSYRFRDCSFGGGKRAIIFPCTFTLNKTKTSEKVTVIGVKNGSYILQLEGVPPVSILFVSGSNESSYFDKSDNIQSSCCSSTRASICGEETPVQLNSSCSWDSDATRGIVFIIYDNLTVPLSLAGVNISSENNIGLPLEDDHAMCSNCTNKLAELGSGKCYKHMPTPNDLSEFVKRQSLTNSFLSSIKSSLFPSWFNISITDDPDSSNKLSSTDYLAKLVPPAKLIDEKGCESLVIGDKNKGRFLVLQHNGPINLTLEDEQSFILNSPSLSDFYCIAVHVCSGQRSPVYIGLPPSAQDGIKRISFISNYITKEWKFDFKSVSLSKTLQQSVLQTKLWNGYQYMQRHSGIHFQYDTLTNMNVQGRFSYGVANVTFTFRGLAQYKYITMKDKVCFNAKIVWNFYYIFVRLMKHYFMEIVLL